MLIILSICTIPTIKDKNILRTNFELEDITSINANSIYLLNKDNLFVKVDIINDGNIHDKIKNIVRYLTSNNEELPKGLSGYLADNTKVLDININKGLLNINLNKFEENTINITGLVYSLLELDGIDKVKIMINGQGLKNYDILDKSIGINNEYLFYNRKEINKVVIYYLDNIYENKYFVPVTMYLNDTREKIEIIIDELKHNKKLISVVSEKLELLNYYEEGNVLFLNFNEELANVDEEAINEVAYSCFANYDVNMVIFEIANKRFDYRKRD